MEYLGSHKYQVAIQEIWVDAFQSERWNLPEKLGFFFIGDSSNKFQNRALGLSKLGFQWGQLKYTIRQTVWVIKAWFFSIKTIFQIKLFRFSKLFSFWKKTCQTNFQVKLFRFSKLVSFSVETVQTNCQIKAFEFSEIKRSASCLPRYGREWKGVCRCSGWTFQSLCGRFWGWCPWCCKGNSKLGKLGISNPEPRKGLTPVGSQPLQLGHPNLWGQNPLPGFGWFWFCAFRWLVTKNGSMICNQHCSQKWKIVTAT